jgi:hypothetical protein
MGHIWREEASHLGASRAYLTGEALEALVLRLAETRRYGDGFSCA